MTFRNVAENHGVGADLGMVAHMHWSDHLGAGTDVDMTADCRHTAMPHTECHLMKYQAIHANHNLGVDDDASAMRHQQASTDAGSKMYFRLCHDRPEAMHQDPVRPHDSTYKAASLLRLFVAPYASQQARAIVDCTSGFLPPPVRDFSTDHLLHPQTHQSRISNIIAFTRNSHGDFFLFLTSLRDFTQLWIAAFAKHQLRRDVLS
jgi:hypothetical protein